MANMTDQTRANAIIQAIFTSSTTFTITPGTSGGSAFTITPPHKLRLMTAPGTNTSNGTEPTAANCPAYTPGATRSRAMYRQGAARRHSGRLTNWEDTESNRRDLVAAYEGGESVRSLARQLCIRTSRVTQVLDESGVQLHPGGRLRFSDED